LGDGRGALVPLAPVHGAAPIHDSAWSSHSGGECVGTGGICICCLEWEFV